jgi:YebC/PmpR family DNA-binding regulatory protein
MAGHSHWAGIKFKKGTADAKKGRVFSKLANQIMLAARTGGPHIESNLRLKFAVDKAKAANIPKDNIERAIKKGIGELPGITLEETTYEGYGPGGVAIMLQILTDNRNRTAGEIRRIFQAKGGNLGSAGCVSWMFTPKALLVVQAQDADEERLLEVALDAGAEDVKHEGDLFEITGSPDSLYQIKSMLEKSGFTVKGAEITRAPNSLVPLDESTGKKVLGLIEALEEHDDVQAAFANYDIPEATMTKIAAQMEK